MLRDWAGGYGTPEAPRKLALSISDNQHMKIQTQKSDLQRELEFLKPAFMSSVEAFKTVRLETVDNGISLKAQNGTFALQTQVKALVDEFGSLDIRGGSLLEIVKSLDKADLAISSKDNRLTLEQGDYACHLLGALDYIAPEEPETTFSITLAATSLRDLLDASIHAVAESDHPHLSAAARLEFMPKQWIRCVSTDGHRMSVGTMPVTSEFDELVIYIPKKCVDIVRAFVNDADSVTLRASDRKLVVEDGNRRLVAGLTSASVVKFPPYEKLLTPTQQNDSFAVDRDALVAAIKRMMIMSVKTHRHIALNVGTDSVRVVVDSAEDGSTAGEMVTIQRDNTTPARIRANAVYLLQAVQAAPAGDVLFRFGNDNVPMLLTPGEPASIETTSLVMPLKDKS
jgi:DNA polymerase-3 subunit beta